MDGFAPWARIIARYALGAALAGSGPLGQALAIDPEVVALVSGALMAAVEFLYMRAKRKGWTL